jgi:hypothetical protein
MPIPSGVPVRISVPGKSVELPLKNSISAGTSKIMSEVTEFCRESPFTRVAIRRAFGSGISSLVMIAGPRGAKVIETLSTTKLSTAPTGLPVAGRYIIRCGVPEDGVESPILCNILALPSDDDRQLAFVIDRVAAQVRGQDDGIAGVLQRVWPFHEKNKMFRKLGSCCLGVACDSSGRHRG